MKASQKIRVAIADDHAMLRSAIVKLLQITGNYEIVFSVNSGEEVKDHLKKRLLPDVLVLDINMSGKDDGFVTARWVDEHYPQIKILALSMYKDESTILKMIQSGAHGYITKDCEPEKLKEAIDCIFEKGIYLSDALSLKLMNGIQRHGKNGVADAELLNDKEKIFLKLLCEELTYDQIAQKMYLSPRTIDDYRKKLARKLKVKGKSGLIVYAISNGFL